MPIVKSKHTRLDEDKGKVDMKRFLLGLVFVSVVAGGFVASAIGAGASPQGKVDVCHHTSSVTNPVVIINISLNAVPHHLQLHGGTGDDFVIDNSKPGFTQDDCIAGALPAVISGVVYDDEDNSGTLATGEPPLGGVAVTLTGTDYVGQAVSLEQLSAADGSYSFAVLPGTYSVAYGDALGFQATTTAEPLPVGAAASPGLVSNVDVSSGAALVLNLPEYPLD
jgi:hypothetical protein